MNKEELLDEITRAAREGRITPDEAQTAAEKEYENPENNSTFSLSTALYFLGGLIAATGLAVLVTQHWESLPSITRILITLGSGVLCYAFGIILDESVSIPKGGLGFHIIAMFILPVGIVITLHEGHVDLTEPWVGVFVPGLLMGIYTLTVVIRPRTVITCAVLGFGTWFFYALSSYIVLETPIYESWNYFAYRTFFIGLSYLFLSRSMHHTSLYEMSLITMALGSVFFLGAALWLGGWKPNQNVFWELVYPLLAFGVIFTSVQWNSRLLLLSGSGFLTLYFIKIAAQYFADTVGWSVALVSMGFILIGCGYVTFQLNEQLIENA